MPRIVNDPASTKAAAKPGTERERAAPVSKSRPAVGAGRAEGADAATSGATRGDEPRPATAGDPPPGAASGSDGSPGSSPAQALAEEAHAPTERVPKTGRDAAARLQGAPEGAGATASDDESSQQPSSDEPAVSSKWDNLDAPSSDDERDLSSSEDRLSADWQSADAPLTPPADVSHEALDTTWVASDGGSDDRRPRGSQPGRKESHADPLIGLVVADRYRIVAPLGRGAMGIVYRVEHTRIGKLLAIKLLAGELSTNKEIVRRFKQEALTVSRLSSPHTVQVFDYGVWQHLTFLVMELVEGPNLGRLLRRGGSMPFARLGRLVSQVCMSLGEAHAKGIVHRDVKPENIMIATDDEGQESAKVLDFGLAKLRESSELNEMTLQGAVVGTPYFISPEQVRGEPVDGRTDIYSLGAVMFRALTGTYPFQSTTPMGMFTKHMTEEPPSACERAPDLEIPLGVSEIVRRCMAKDPDDRFPTVEALREAILREIRALGLPSQAGLPPGEGPPASIKAGKGLRRRTKRGERLGSTQIATRDEVEAYQRKLRRATWVARGLLWTVAAGLIAGGVVIARRLGQVEFTGLEQEPNDTAARANPLPLGESIRGKLGERLDSDTGDRDLYAFDVPAGPTQPLISLRVSSLPNIAMETLLYREGFEHPLARFRTGWPGSDLVVPSLEIEPGRHFIAVVQDRDKRDGTGAQFVFENVSDFYKLTVAPAEPAAGDEREPNDEVSSAQTVALGQTVRGTLAWLDDRDVYCAPEDDPKPVRWRIDDGARPVGAVLEATPLVGADSAPLVRVHAPGLLNEQRAASDADVASPWTCPELSGEGQPRCVSLRLAVDPLVERVGPEPPRPDQTQYSVTLLQ